MRARPPQRHLDLGHLDLDVAVVGAGPAGIAAGIAASDRGLRVVVLDKARFPRDKTCGDGLTAAALRELRGLGVHTAELAGYASVRETVIVGPRGRRVLLPLPGDGEHAGVVPRAELDAALVETARARGVRVETGAGLTDLVEHEHGLELRTGDGATRSAAFVIGADGHFSTVRKLFDAEPAPRLGTWHAFRQYWSGVDDPRLWVFFEPDLLPGYAWVFPLPGGRANVGFGVLRDASWNGRRLAERWRDLLRRPHLRAVLGAGSPEAPHRAWPIPGHLDVERVARGRVLYVGDAAGAVDPLTGEGIAQALETGRRAADAIAAGGGPDAVADRYRSEIARTLGRDLRFAALLQRVLRRPAAARAALRIVDSSDWTRRQFGRWMFEDYPRAILGTPDRWHRRMLCPAGVAPTR